MIKWSLSNLPIAAACLMGGSLLFAAEQGITFRPGRNALILRGQTQYIFYYPASATSGLHPALLFAPGDGGWRGMAITMAERMAGWGYALYGLDTRQYLESFTGRSGLKESDVAGDMRRIAEWVSTGKGETVGLVGWSEGAGLMLLAAASQGNERKFSGLVTMGLPDVNALGWSWLDGLTDVIRHTPREPTFSALAYMDRVSPLPLAMIQSSKDEYVPLAEARSLFDRAREPKRFFLIDALNHHFDGNREIFFSKLREALRWINGLQRQARSDH